MSYNTMEEAANAHPMKPMEPEDRLEHIVADLNSEAAQLEQEARDLEDRMLLCRARAAGLRTGAQGVADALGKFKAEMAKRQEFMANRDGEDVPRAPAPYDINAGRRGGYPDGH